MMHIIIANGRVQLFKLAFYVSYFLTLCFQKGRNANWHFGLPECKMVKLISNDCEVCLPILLTLAYLAWYI